MSPWEALDPLSVSFADMLRRRSSVEDDELLLAGALACWAPSAGHTCVDLARVSEHLLDEDDKPLQWPSVEDWAAKVGAWTEVVRRPDEDRRAVLVLDGTGLYMERTWGHEQGIAEALVSRAAASARMSEKNARNLARQRWKEPSDQRQAAELAIRSSLTVITGGPGTGKTTMVASLLGLLGVEALSEGRRLRALLLAPTGKAQERLGQSVRENLQDPKWAPQHGAARVDLECMTLHKGLGSMGLKRQFRHGPDHPIRADVVVLDEASMVDAGMMARLLAAVPSSARLILLGDPSQLQAVDYGSVLGDICEAIGPVGDCVARLTQSFRTGAESRIRVLDAAIRKGDSAGALELFEGDVDEVVRLGRSWQPAIRERLVATWAEVRDADSPAAALKAQRGLGLLCAHRSGHRGVSGLNEAAETWLQQAGLIDPREPWYEGRPVMVLRNDKGVDLRNGQVGLVHGGQVWFDPDNPRALTPGMLPEHTTCFAMTVHKSQGSEFDEVFVVLPTKTTQLTTRQLLYTAVTRAKVKVTVVGPKEVVAEAVATEARRMSGLPSRLC